MIGNTFFFKASLSELSLKLHTRAGIVCLRTEFYLHTAYDKKKRVLSGQLARKIIRQSRSKAIPLYPNKKNLIHFMEECGKLNKYYLPKSTRPF